MIARSLLGGLLLAIVISPALAEDGFQPLALANEKPAAARRLTFAADGTVKLNVKADDKPVDKTVKLADIVTWGAPAEFAGGPLVLLVDGSVIVQSQRGGVSIEGEQLKVTGSQLATAAFPLEYVRGVIFQRSGDVQRTDRELYELVHPREDKNSDDVLRLANGDLVTGSVLTMVDQPDGKRCEVKTNVGDVKIELARVAALRFDPTLLAKAPTVEPSYLVGLADGTRLVVTRLETAGDQVKLQPLCAAARDVTFQAPRDALVFVQPLSGKVRYLSDLPVEGYRHVPYLTTAWPYELDRNVIGTQLRAGGRLYAKGVGMHSTARLTFQLDKPYRRFDAALAIDDQTGGRGNVTCRVFVDSEQRWASGPIRGGQPVEPLSLDVSGGKLLSLIVDFGDGGDVLDRVDWLDARLVE